MKKKAKVRLVVPQGAKGKIKNGTSEASDLVIPPGQMKFTGIGEDGQLEAEVVNQISAQDYLKNVEETSMAVSAKSDNKKVSILAKRQAEEAKKTRKEMMISSGTPSSVSGTAKMTLEKSNSIVERAEEQGFSMFTPETMKSGERKIFIEDYVDEYEKKLLDSISSIKKSRQIKLFDETNEKVKELISSSSEKQLRIAIQSVAFSIHQDIDRRVRSSMTKSSLEEFLSSGKISNVNLGSQSLSAMKKKRDEFLGNKKGLNEFSFTPVELMHGIFVDKTEEMLYSAGTRVGSEEFADTGRGIEIVLRAENSPRIGYGIKDSYEDNSLFSFLNEEDKRIIELSIFGLDSKMSEEKLVEILEAYVSGDPSNLLIKNNEETLEAFIIGDISLNDIEHVKIPLSIFNVRNKKVPASDPIAGKNRLSILMRGRKVSETKIKEFFEKDGTIGGGFTPKYVSYLAEYEAALELKETLISLGISDVVFTNKEGINIMSEDTWSTPKPNQKNGVEALRQIARKEIEEILDKVAPKPKPPKMPKPKKEKK
jgi:hypothetical protein